MQKTYIIELIDGSGDHTKYTGVFTVSRDIRLKTIQEHYQNIRNEWFENDIEYCSLEEYLVEKLASYGIDFHIEHPEYDDTWWF